MNLKGIYTKYVHFLLKFTLPYMVIALIFALQRWDDSISNHYIGHTLDFKESRLFLHIAIIADWSKHGKIQANSC